MYFSHIFLKVSFNYVLLSRLLYSAKGISATDILPVMCLGSDVALNKSKFIIIIIITVSATIYKVPPMWHSSHSRNNSDNEYVFEAGINVLQFQGLGIVFR